MPIDFNRGELSRDEFMAKMIEKLKVVKYALCQPCFIYFEDQGYFLWKKEKGAKTNGNHNHWSLTVDNAQK